MSGAGAGAGAQSHLLACGVGIEQLHGGAIACTGETGRQATRVECRRTGGSHWGAAPTHSNSSHTSSQGPLASSPEATNRLPPASATHVSSSRLSIVSRPGTAWRRCWRRPRCPGCRWPAGTGPAALLPPQVVLPAPFASVLRDCTKMAGCGADAAG